MPNIRKSYDGKETWIDFETYEELPNNVKIFISQAQRLGLDKGLELNSFRVTKDESDNVTENDLDLDLFMDAEEFAKGSYSNLPNIERRLDSYSVALGIDNWHIFKRYINKEKFAEKFLKGLKKHLKTTVIAQYIHQIRFDVVSKYDFEIKVIKKSYTGYMRDTTIRDIIKDYLESVGYPKIKVNIVN